MFFFFWPPYFDALFHFIFITVCTLVTDISFFFFSILFFFHCLYSCTKSYIFGVKYLINLVSKTMKKMTTYAPGAASCPLGSAGLVNPIQAVRFAH